MKTRLIVTVVVNLLLAAVGESAYADTTAKQPLTVNIKRLSLDTALRIGKAAIDKCREEGVQITVTVVDRGGHEQVVLRDVLAMDLSIPISKKKAYTAMSFNTPTSALANRFEGAYSVPKVDELIIAAGGVPITIAGTIMGGVGVSGAPSGLTDERCAQAGLAAVQEDLELD
ncbi:MAG: heme-binding protein [Gammaproteobacteria bacterium]|nr:heme-binding protein [Gammaproteobacteria bacterium]